MFQLRKPGFWYISFWLLFRNKKCVIFSQTKNFGKWFTEITIEYSISFNFVLIFNMKRWLKSYIFNIYRERQREKERAISSVYDCLLPCTISKLQENPVTIFQKKTRRDILESILKPTGPSSAKKMFWQKALFKLTYHTY